MKESVIGSCVDAMMDMSSPKLDVNLNPTVISSSPISSPASPDLLDNENLKRRSTGLTAFNDYVDLVKRHLMYAVREEVELLKQKIGELMERIGQLEYENTILRSEAKSETLAKLLTPRSQQPTQAAGQTPGLVLQQPQAGQAVLQTAVPSQQQQASMQSTTQQQQPQQIQQQQVQQQQVQQQVQQQIQQQQVQQQKVQQQVQQQIQQQQVQQQQVQQQQQQVQQQQQQQPPQQQPPTAQQQQVQQQQPVGQAPSQQQQQQQTNQQQPQQSTKPQQGQGVPTQITQVTNQ